MATPRKRKPFNPTLAINESRAFVDNHLRTQDLGLPDLGDENFKTVMDAIVRSMILAWVAGYTRGLEG